MAGGRGFVDSLPSSTSEGVIGMDHMANTTEIDDRFIGEWVDYGFREMRAYLDKHARFARYLDDRENRR
jgi:hypothetical protein